MSKISIALATYNGDKYIEEQLESLARQTRSPLELVVCDDGSTDRTLEILENFQKKCSFPVRIYKNKENVGHADNFLTAASLCRGNWISFCDQDDIWSDRKLEIINSYIGDNPRAVLIAHPAELIQSNSESTGVLAWPSRYKMYERLTMPFFQSGMGCGQTFRSYLVHEIPFGHRFRTVSAPSVVTPHDDWIVKISQCVGPACYIPEVLIKRRRHERSVTSERMPPIQTGGHRSAEIFSTLRRKRGRPVESRQLTDASKLLLERSTWLSESAKTVPRNISSQFYDASDHFAKAANILSARAKWRADDYSMTLTGLVKIWSSTSYWKMPRGTGGWLSALRDILELFNSEKR